MLASLATIALLLMSWTSFFAQSPALAPPVNRNHTVCTAPAEGDVACLAKVYAAPNGAVSPAATTKVLPAGLSPDQLRSAYGVPTGSGGRVAIIGAYDNPTALNDLNKYSQTFGLPQLPGCSNTKQAGCFAKYDQRGGQLYPFRDRGWAFETALDIQTVHAVCPTCRIDLIEAGSASISNLMAAVDRAVALGNTVVSMSWGAGEFASETSYDSHFNAPNVAFVAATGDDGYGAGWPAASSRVLAAGGTTLTLTSSGARATETAWSGAGSGCSAYEAKPAWQHDTGCTRRTIADVAAVADPATGAAIYSSYSPYGTGWFQVGGTSLSTPIIASLIAQGVPTTQADLFARLYSAAAGSSLYDVKSGKNGNCSPSYLCTAGPSFDGPTGLGSPIGLGAL